MTQQVVLARIKLHAFDPVTDDPSISLHFEATGTNTSVDQSSLVAACAGFLNNTAGGAVNPVGHYISKEISRNSGDLTVELYDITGVLGGGAMGSPLTIYTDRLTPNGTGNALPAGVAAAFNYEADYGTDVEFLPGSRPRSRDRNRFYLGPLNDNTLAYDATTQRPKFTSTFINDVQRALSDISLLNATEPNQMSLVVWSRKNAGVKHAVRSVADDRPDYQRRRSDTNPGTRTTWSLPD